MRTIPPLLLLLLLSATARAEEDLGPTRTARRLETLVRQAVRGPDITDPSPTRLVADLLREKPATLRAALRDAWDSRHLLSWDAARSLEEIARLLHGLGPDGKRPIVTRPPASGLWEHRGVILVRTVRSGERWDGPFRGADAPPFDEHLGPVDLRPPPHPTAADLFAILANRTHDTWGLTERLSLFLLIGETARDDPALRTELLTRLRANPRSRPLAVALGAAGGLDAVTALRERLLAAIPRTYRYSAEAHELGCCLARADPNAPRDALRTLEGDARTSAIRSIGMRLVLPVVLDQLEQAKDPESRRRAIAEMEEIARESRGYGNPPGPVLPRLFRQLVALLDQGGDPERRAVDAIAHALLGAWQSYPVASAFSVDGNTVTEDGQALGAPTGVGPLLRSLAADTAAGRLIYLDRRGHGWRAPVPFLSPRPVPVRADGSRAHTDIPCPVPNLSEPDPHFPVHASAEWTEQGLRLSLRNTGPRTFLVNPVALRYARASLTTIRVRRKDEAPTKAGKLELALGSIHGQPAVPARLLHAVAPGDSYSWTIPVRPEQRNVQHVVIGLALVPILGRATHPVLLTMNNSWIR